MIFPKKRDVAQKKSKMDFYYKIILFVIKIWSYAEFKSFKNTTEKNVEKSLIFLFRGFPATRTNPFEERPKFDATEFDEDDPPPLTTAKTDFPGQVTTPSPFEFGAKLAKAKSSFANRFKFNRRKFLNDIKEKTGSIKFVNTKRNRARLNEEARKRRPLIHQIPKEPISNDYDDPEPRTTARSTFEKKHDPAPRPTRRPIPKLEFTTPAANVDEDPEPATTAKGILNQAIAHNKKRIKAQILKQKKEITRSGIVPPPRTFLLNRKENAENLDQKKEFKIIDAEDLFDAFVEKNAPTTTTTTTTSTTIAPTTTTTTESVEYLDEDSSSEHVNLEKDVAEESSTTFSSVSFTATTLKPILEKEPLVPEEVILGNNIEGSGDVLPDTTSSNTNEPNTNQNPSTELENTSIQTETSTSNTVTIPPLDSKEPEKIPTPVPLTQNKSSHIDASKSLGEILAELPKEKLEKFKQYLLTLNKEDKKLVSKMLQSNLEAARKSITTTTVSPSTNSDAVIDLGILGSFRLEKPKRL